MTRFDKIMLLVCLLMAPALFTTNRLMNSKEAGEKEDRQMLKWKEGALYGATIEYEEYSKALGALLQSQQPAAGYDKLVEKTVQAKLRMLSYQGEVAELKAKLGPEKVKP